jgi:RHS repeat-associated protein
VSGPAGDTTYTWNDRGLVTRSSGPGGVSTFTYDGEGNLTSRADPTGTGTFTYDAAGRLATATDPLTALTATLGYAATGEVASVGYGSGKPSRVFGRDNLGRLTTDTVKGADGSTVALTTYAYDLDNLLTTRTTTGLAGAGTNRYGYDGLSRLTSWTRPDNQVVSYVYDAASNRTSAVGPSGTRTFTYDARNRLLTASGGGSPSATNTWSPRGTLDAVDNGGSVTQYGFDAFDKLLRTAAPGVTTTYTYDAAGRLAQRNGVAVYYTDQTDNAVRVPTASGDTLVFRTPDGTAWSDKPGVAPARLLVADQVHGDSVAALGNPSGALLASAAYAPYGEVAASNGTLPSGFQGSWTDATNGLVNTTARWYAPTSAAFTSRDAVTLDPDPVAHANRYAYGDAKPTTMVDPSGNTPIPFVLPAAAAAGGVSIGAIATGGLLVIAAGAVIYAGYQCYKHCGDLSWGSAPDWGPTWDQIRALEALGNTSLTQAMNTLLLRGVSPERVLAIVRAKFATDADVIRITGSARPVAVDTTDWGAVAKAYTDAANAAFAAALAAAKAPSTPTILHTPRPPIELTITDLPPSQMSLLPAGVQIGNGGTVAAGAPRPPGPDPEDVIDTLLDLLDITTSLASSDDQQPQSNDTVTPPTGARYGRALDIIRQAKGEKKAADAASNVHLAMGRDVIDGRAVLVPWAAERNAVTWHDKMFADIWVGGATTDDNLLKMMKRVVDGGGRISFNLDGVADLDKIVRGERLGTTTNREIYLICLPENAAIRAVTTFVGGQPC